MKWVWDDLDVPPPTQRAWVAAFLVAVLVFLVIATALVTGPS
jgi:HAMP domain-containing protein